MFGVVGEIMTLAYSVKSPLPLFGGSLNLNYQLSLRDCRIALSTHHASNSTYSQRVSKVKRGCIYSVELLQGRRRNLAHDPSTCYDDHNDDHENNRSLDLLMRFVHNVLKVSKRARKAVRSVLHFPISSHLVRFSVNGILLLAFLLILKAFLQVLCTLGSVVFVSILLIRGIWSAVSFLLESRHQK